MLEMAEWLAVGDWRDTEAARKEIREFAAELLSQRRWRLKRRSRRLFQLADEGRHRVRIEAKKLGYAAEFFAGLWTSKKAGRRRTAFAKAIEALQDEQGELNDAAHGASVLARLRLAEAPPELADPAPRLKRAGAA